MSSMFTFMQGPVEGAYPAFDILKPEVRNIHLQDIGWGLAGIYRFNGQSPIRKSVARHCIEVGEKFPATTHSFLKLWGLLHDAAEAYLGDFIRPHKSLITIDGKPVHEVEEGILKTIAEYLGVSYPTEDDWAQIKIADNQSMLGEKELLWQRKALATIPDEVPTKVDYSEWMHRVYETLHFLTM